MRTTKVYFPGLNTLRFYAAVSIVLQHMTTFTPFVFVPQPLVRDVVELITLGGQEAVSLFFVLSGFLITYLLLDEQRRTGTIRVRQFYKRRARRIMPLYFLVAALSLLVTFWLIPNTYMQPDALGLITIPFFATHIAAAFGYAGLVSHFWTIGIEEWFYFALPPLVKRWRVPMIALIVILARVLLVAVLDPTLLLDNNMGTPLRAFLAYTRFECMAFGAFGAWLYIHRHPLLRAIYRYERLVWVLMGLIILAPARTNSIFYELATGVLYMALILNASTNLRSRIRLEHPALSWWGQRTYGIYM